MPVPSGPTYSAAALVAAHTAFRDLIDGGTGAGYVLVRDNLDVLLAQIPLPEPCGTVNGTTGQLTFDVTGAEDASANSSGTAAYAEFCDGDGTVHLALLADTGTTPVSGKFVMNTQTVVGGQPVTLVSATIG